MKFYLPAEPLSPQTFPLLNSKVSAGFPSPAIDYIETRIDLYKYIANHSFIFFAIAEGDSMNPQIRDGNIIAIDRQIDVKNGDVVMASLYDEFCVKRYFGYPDGSVELRPDNPKFESINLPSEFEGKFEIFGKVTFAGGRVV
jgi:DNA polymerase V